MREDNKIDIGLDFHEANASCDKNNLTLASIAEEVQEEGVLDCGPVEGRRKQLAVAVPGYAH